MATLDDLAREFCADGVTWERGPGDLPFLVIATSRCSARLTPYGAHICEWTPAGAAAPVLFLSPRAVFAAGTPIRGGVPLCFPWFAAHATDPAKPAHGFARTRMWEMTDVIADETSQVHVGLRLTDDAATRALWDAAFEASFTISLGTTLTMALAVENRGAQEIAYESAMHTYLHVGDVEQIRLRGLEDAPFIDKVDGRREKRLGRDPLTFAGDTDRVFGGSTTTCVVDDPTLRRRIRVEKHGSATTVVWNPGRAKGEAVSDIGEAWRRFVCVETANCAPHVTRLAPGDRHVMTASLSVGAR